MTDTPLPLPPCNIVMKGGITSGVVYPLTIVALAQKYRFRGIGGTSAGAIAAALTAAAELGRGSGGFERLAAVASELPEKLRSLFQPAPRGRASFNFLMAMAKRRGGWAKARALPQLAWRFPLTFLAGVAPAAALGVWGHLAGHGLFSFVALLPCLVLGLLFAFGLRFATTLLRLRRDDFGFCPGIRQPGAKEPALLDWLDVLLDQVAGRADSEKPLTFGDLDAAGIELQCFTTCLSLGRPYVMPWETDEFFYRPGEMRQIFPKRVVAWMDEHSQPFDGDAAFRKLPPRIDLPVLLAVRLSLAFPFLFTAVPLWMRDFGRAAEAERQVPRRVLFSDGGMSSNLPLQLFDRLWPTMPTFAITLDRWSADHHQRPGEAETRVWLPESAGSGRLLPITPITSTGAFVGRLIKSMKEWNDQLQGTLPGYRERIAHICLKDEEGGLNLNMSPEQIAQLVGFGKEAGETLRDDFDWDAHHWTRMLSAIDRLAGSLAALDDASIALVRNRPRKNPHKPKSEAWQAQAADTLEELRRIGSSGLAPNPVPKPLPQLRIVPRP
jgi:predicted acylesterase/phospholipase RssA